MVEGRNIKNLGSGIMRHIFKYLDVQDLENVHQAFPEWRRVIEVQLKQRRIRQFTWLDEEMYKLVLHPYAIFTNSDQLIKYYTDQRELSVPERPIESCGKLKILFLYHELDAGNAEMWFDSFDLFKEASYLRRNLRRKIQHVSIATMNIPSMVLKDITSKGKMTLPAISQQHIMQANRFSEFYLSRLASFDVLFYFVDYSKPIADVLTFLRRALTPRHSLIISVIRDANDSTLRNMGYFIKLISIIEEFIYRKLKDSQIQWRLWCVERGCNGKPNFREMLEWFSTRWNNN
ncbi:unnamed protein product [Rodentolepis nana]|uniref:F-box domain-containing protein n=1 Tax=Rodentolepis nana TaxID=102285 RepID=A0A0R3TPD6_RODNA|nr:unnamed protein product [Rodentolepis nana]